ncbi:MAG TPA: protein kinase, partial [Polyangia bacterium]|nr:protein kinase [Polyangia bacterium]
MAGTLPTGDGDEEPAPRQLGEGGRYRLLRSLGRGAFGSVFHAVDSKYDGAVAIKLLHRRNADALYRFKREFRDLVDLIHPNLVRLYELSNDGERWFVVMELVDGVDLRSFLRGVGVGAARAATVTARSNAGAATALASAPQWVEIDLPRLRATFAQFVRGIQALHAAHKLHRDLKPSNVLVAPDGRVVILDFGLMVELDRALGALSGPGIGTPGYMAPEQARDAPLSPAADWYAVGAMLYEVLTGATPVHGATAFDDSRVPRGLRDLVDRLLAGDPRRRPDGDEILSVLEAVPSSAGSTAAFTSTGIVGRDAELRLLDRARAEARVTPVLVRIRGVSGVGKTTLLSTWADRVEAAGDGEWVLRGRCFEHEDVPFKAIDGVVDALAERLMAEPELVRPTLSLESLRAAARMFPVLGGLLGAAPPSSDVQPRAQRDRAMAGMRELFASVAAIHPLVMCIDDAHWGDADSARVVAELLQLSAAKLLIVTSERPSAALDAFPAALSDWLGDRARAPARDVELRELGADDARALAAVCGSAPDDAPRIALESGGNPFFIR